jgi:WD40 repeat protein
LVGNDREWRIHDRLKGESLHRVHAETGFFSPSSKLVMLRESEQTGEWILQETQTAKTLCKIRCPDITPVAFTKDEKWLAWHEKDGSVRVVEAATGKTLRRLGEGRADWDMTKAQTALTFSPSGRHLAAWNSKTRIVHLWDLAKGNALWRRFAKEPIGTATEQACLAFSRDGSMLAVSGLDGDNDIRLLEVSSGKVRRVLTGHRAPVTSLAFSPDGRLLGSGSADTTVLVWDVYD